MKIDKSIHNLITWSFEYLIDILICIPITYVIMYFIPYTHSMYNFTNVFISLSVGRTAFLEYKRYCLDEIVLINKLSNTKRLTDDIILILMSKTILILKLVGGFTFLFIINKLLAL
jgi:hypothetical protein